MEILRHFLPALAMIIGLQGCGENRLYGRFSNYHAETLWTYDFNLDGSFDVSATGHIGNVSQSGKYAVRDGTIALFYGEESSFGNNFESRFYVRSEDEIVDRAGRHYWTNLDGRYADWKAIENRNDHIKAYLERQRDYQSYFAQMSLDSMVYSDVIVNGVLKSGKKVLDVHYVTYSHPDYRRDIAPYPLRRYVDPATGEVFRKKDNDELVLDTVLAFQ